MEEFLIGEIIAFGGNFVIKGWAACEGQEFPIASAQALYRVIGNLYGGTPGRTFKVPDLRGRAAIGFGAGPGLSAYTMAQAGGASGFKLTADLMPKHTHTLYGTNTDSNTVDPTGAYPAPGGPGRTPPSKYKKEVTSGAQLSAMHVNSVATYGKNPQDQVEVSVMQAYVPFKFLICLEGSFPEK